MATSCSICLDQLKDPVTIPCGHSYCMGCIKGCSDQEDDKGIYSCPQCGHTFPSSNLTEITENKKNKGKAALPYKYAGPGDVECDFCKGRKLKAVKSCLVCLVSFCETHLQPHYEVAPLKKHKLVQASEQLQEKICSHHDKLLEIYCRTDQQCICYLCTVDQHRSHDTVSAAAGRTEKQKLLGEEYRQSEERIKEKETKIQALKQAMDSLKRSAKAAVEDSEKIFTELIRSLKKKRFELNEKIRAQEKAEVSRVVELLEQLEQEVSELRRKDVELKQLSHTEDHIHFLQSFQSLCVSSGSEVLPSITINPHVSFEHVNISVAELQDELQDMCMKEMEQIFVEVTQVQIDDPAEPRTKKASLTCDSTTNEMNLVTTDGTGPDYSEPKKDSSALTTVEQKQRAQPKTRKDFLTYSCQLTLDPNTANQYLCLSEGNRMVTWSDEVQCYPDHPDRFTSFHQVLCREGLSGTCYWELDWSGEGVDVAVSYKGIGRKGSGFECLFGSNDQSWRLYCSTTSCYFYHNKDRTDITVPGQSKVGVYLDHRAGTLSFYSVSDKMTLLHKVETTFTQPLYPGFFVETGYVKILTPIPFQSKV